MKGITDTEKLTVYILEDEPHIREDLLSLLKNFNYLRVLGCAADLAKATLEIPELCPQLILADIHLRDGNSLSMLNDLDLPDTQIVFLTAYDRYAIQALNIGAFAYLLKPLDIDMFNDTLEECYRSIKKQRMEKRQLELATSYYNERNRPRRIALRSVEFTQIVAIQDILYCQSDKGYTTFHVKNLKPIMVSRIIKDYENILPSDQFIRCHQSYLVNGNYISCYYKDGCLEMLNGDRIPVSDRKKETIVDYIRNL